MDECRGPSPIALRYVSNRSLGPHTRLGQSNRWNQPRPALPTHVGAGSSKVWSSRYLSPVRCYHGCLLWVFSLSALSAHGGGVLRCSATIFGGMALTLFMATAAFAHSSANSADPHSEFISPKVGAWVGGSQVVPGPTHRHSIPGMKLQAVARMSEGVGSPSLSSRTPLFTEDRAGILIMPHPSVSTLPDGDGKQGQNLRLSGPLTIAPRLIPSYW